MGKHLAAYHVLTGPGFTLSRVSDVAERFGPPKNPPAHYKVASIKFMPPNDIDLENETSRPVLSFLLDPSNDAQSLDFRVWVRSTGDREIDRWTISGGQLRSVNTVINRPKEVLRNPSDIGHLVMFGLRDDAVGGVSISNVILWFVRRT